MSNNETVVVVLLIMAAVIVVALYRFSDEVRAVIQLPWGRGKVILDAINKRASSPKKHSHPRPKLAGETQVSRPWLTRHWRGVLALSLMLLLIVAPAAWWFEQPAPWRMLLSSQFREFIHLLGHSGRVVHVNRSRATLDWITNMLEMRTDKLNDRNRDEQIWIVDHYWQYWNTSNFQTYLTVNKTFVARGGTIHRMFFLTQDELNNPDAQRMLQAQCQIGRLGGDQTGNGFELWRADPGIMNGQEEYKTVSRQFQQLANTDMNFEDFDLMQFNDALYYSSDFSTDYRVLGSSTWIFDPDQVKKINVQPLFNKNIAERISCNQVLQQSIPQQADVTAGRNAAGQRQ